MELTEHNATIDRKVLFSTIWLFILLNIIFRDIHEFISPGFLEEALTGHVDGQKITEGLIFIGALIVEIPIAMVLLSRVLNYKINRWFNIFAAVITIAVTLSSVPKVPADIFTDFIVILASLFIAWTAWRWQKSDN